MAETAQIVGRDAELAMLRAFADFTVAGPAAMVLEGEPGIGKTALWEAGVAVGRDAGRVLACRAARAEARLSLAGLADLLTPAADEFLPTLPQPQARTLEVALLRVEPGRAPLQRRALMAAVLAALRSIASACPLLLAIDDLQWLDVSTAEALGFAMRRLDGARVRLLTTVRVPGKPPRIDLAADLGADMVRRVTVGQLPVEAIGTIVRAVAPSLSWPMVWRLHEAARGNPLYATELVRWLPSGGLLADEPLRVPPSVRDLVRRRLAAMPEETRQVLLLAAAAPSPSLDRLADDGAAASIERDLAPAIAGGVVEIDGDLVRFAHPLWAAAAYAAASAGRRRTAHRRLAEGRCGTEERARHLALAAGGPDEAVAAALAAAAEQARARGAAWPAAELAGHAARLSPDAQPRYDRAITAAQYLFGAGDAAGARHTLEALLGEALDDHMRARALLALSRVRMHELDFRPVISILERALACAEGDPSLQAEIRVMLAFQSDDDFPAGLAHVRAAVELLSEAGDPAALARALSAEMAMRDLCHGVVPATVIDGALAAERLAAPARVRDRPSYRLGVCLRSAGDVPAALVRLRAALAAVDAEQDEASRSEVLVSVVRAELLAGEWDAAWRHAAEAVDALMLPEQRAAEQIVRALQAEIDALRGLLVEAKATAEQVLRESAVAGAVIAPLFALAALGFASLCQDDPVAAVGYLKQADDLALSQGQGGPGNFPYHGDYAEALIWAGELDQAAAVIARLRAHGEELGRAWLLAVAERCQAMLCAARGDADGAISAAQSALDRHERLAIPFEAGRAHLAAGGIHRRAKHKRQAANHLSQAAIIFDKLGAPLWSARAHAELSRVGLRADSKFALTQTERQVAALVVQGLSNREVAGRLFVSVRTVESNLSRIYRKLGVRSRTEMVRAMAARELNMSGTDPVGLVAF